MNPIEVGAGVAVDMAAVGWSALAVSVGLTVTLAGRADWTGTSDRSRRLSGIDLRARVVSPRKRIDGEAAVGAIAVDATDRDIPLVRRAR